MKARRLAVTKDSVRAHLVSGDFADVRGVVESLAAEFDVLDVAAAAVKLAHTVTARDGEEQEIEAPPRKDAREAGMPRQREGKRPRGAPDDDNATRLFIGLGRRAGIRPADLVGAITGEAGVPSRVVGPIEISDNFSLVGVPAELADDIIAAMKKANLRGQRFTIRRDRPAKG